MVAVPARTFRHRRRLGTAIQARQRCGQDIGRAQRRRRIVVAQLDRQRGIQFFDRFLISTEIVQEHALVMQYACIIHVGGALLPADQSFELLRQRSSPHFDSERQLIEACQAE